MQSYQMPQQDSLPRCHDIPASGPRGGVARATHYVLTVLVLFLALTRRLLPWTGGPGSGRDHKQRANLGEMRAQAGHEADKDSESVSVHDRLDSDSRKASLVSVCVSLKGHVVTTS